MSRVAGAGFSIYLVCVLLFVPAAAQAADECGAGASAQAGISRFTAWRSGGVYVTGDLVRHSGSVYRKTGTTSTLSPESALSGWTALTSSEFAANEITCDQLDTVTAATNIFYDDNDLAIVFSRSGIFDTVNSIGHTGQGG